jgi:hypothetical protein
MDVKGASVTRKNPGMHPQVVRRQTGHELGGHSQVCQADRMLPPPPNATSASLRKALMVRRESLSMIY